MSAWADPIEGLFETMIFGGAEEYQERYTTIEQAREGHEVAVALVASGEWPG